MKICQHCIVSGQVQGVFYRASTQAQARQFGVTGYAINRSDGTVEVLACGEPDQVTSLVDWLHTGPAHASVDRVDCKQVPFVEHDSFKTG